MAQLLAVTALSAIAGQCQPPVSDCTGDGTAGQKEVGVIAALKRGRYVTW